MKYGYTWVRGFSIFIIGTLIGIIVAVIPLQAQAEHRHRHWQHRHHGQFHHGWVWPALIGGTIVYAVTRPDPIIVPQAPVIIQNQYVVVDGVTYRRELIIVNGIEQEVLVKQ